MAMVLVQSLARINTAKDRDREKILNNSQQRLNDDADVGD
jgi:hypothetical protein